MLVCNVCGDKKGVGGCASLRCLVMYVIYGKGMSTTTFSVSFLYIRIQRNLTTEIVLMVGFVRFGTEKK